MLKAGSITALALALTCISSVSCPAGCPLAAATPASLSGPLAGKAVLVASNPPRILFQSVLEQDDDGAPTAYHWGNADDSDDPGLDHICNGASVLELVKGKLVDRYASGGSIGSLSGVDPATQIRRSRLCKQDYIAIRDAGFPACGPSHRCMIFYGIASRPRPCGFPNAFGRDDDPRCGVPILQKDKGGTETKFYLTTTTLRSPSAVPDSQLQTDYVDGSLIPFIVMPSGLELPGNADWEPGDLAVVVRADRTSYAVVGDTGPSNKIGEASRALLSELSGGNPAAIKGDPLSATIIFPGTRNRMVRDWPLDPAKIVREGHKIVDETGGIAELRRCPGLEAIQ
jgi:hypothetical protein